MDEPATLKTLKEVEEEHIRMALEAMDGNMAATARVLGIDRRTLYRKATSLGLQGHGRRGRIPKHVVYLERRVVELEQRLAKHEGVGPK